MQVKERKNEEQQQHKKIYRNTEANFCHWNVHLQSMIIIVFYK